MVHAQMESEQKPKTSLGNPDSRVQKFFQHFSQALTAGDIESIKKCWGYPSFVLGNATQMAVKTESEIERFFAGTQEQYHRRGIMEAIPEIENIQWLTKKIALVGVRWPYYDREGREIGEESSCYTLKMDEQNQLHIYCIVMQGEKPKKNQSTH